MTIKNFNTTTILDSTGRWTVSIPNNINASLAVVKQLTYYSVSEPGANPALYSINCDLSVDPIGTVLNIAGFNSNPQMQIKLPNPNITSIQFWLTSLSVPISSASGDLISISISFYSEDDLKYL